MKPRVKTCESLHAARPSVKICGLMREEDVLLCARHGANMLGFVVDYPRDVPWNLNVQDAIKLIHASPVQSCVVMDGSAEKILGLAREMRPDFMQLHACGAALCGELRKFGVGVIATLSPALPDLTQAAERLCRAGVHALLLDPRRAAQGGAADFAGYAKLKAAVDCPVILAGGLNPENVRQAVEQTNAAAIDLMSGVESSPGRKDATKVAALFQALDT